MSSKATTPLAEPATMFLGAGAIYLNYGEGSERLIGQTKGGSTFTREVEISEIEGDGSFGKVVGHRIKQRVQPMLTIQALELSKQNFIDFIPGITSTDQTTYFELRESLCIPDSDYFVNVAFVGEDKACNNDLIIIVENALPDDNFELAFEDKEAVIAEVIFNGHYGRSTPTVIPYEIRYPVDDVTAPTVISDPVDAAGSVAISATLTFTFNETMDVSTLNTSNIILMQQDGTPEPYTLSIDATKKIVTIIQTSDLQAATAYIMMASIGCEDLAGNGLAANEITNFTTA